MSHYMIRAGLITSACAVAVAILFSWLGGGLCMRSVTMPRAEQKKVEFSVTWAYDSNNELYTVNVIRDGVYMAKGCTEDPSELAKLTSSVIKRTITPENPFDAFASNWGR